jgi:hypothetical protein
LIGPEGGIADDDENRHIMEAVAARIMALVEGRTGGNVVHIIR